MSIATLDRVTVEGQVIRGAFVILLAVHGLIHLLGAAKAFQWAELPQLPQPISRPFGALWLAAALLFVVMAVSLFAWPRWWWVIGACAVAVSMFVIVPSWTDARVGAFANSIVVVAVVFGFLSQGPFSLRRECRPRRHERTVC